MDDRTAAVLAEGPPEVNGVLQRVLDFLAALRRAGVPTALSEGIDAVRLLLAAYIALVGYQVASSSGSPRGRAMIYACSVLVVAVAIAVTKNVLGGH